MMAFTDKTSARRYFRNQRKLIGTSLDGSATATALVKNLPQLIASFANNSPTELQILSYTALPGELQLKNFNQVHEKHLLLPHYSFTAGSVKNPTPPAFQDFRGRIYSPTEITADLIFVPGLAFSVSGQRLGQGGGWYDRAIAGLRLNNPNLLVIGCCAAEFIVEQLPTEAHDEPVRGLLTENSLRWVSGQILRSK